MLGPSRLEVPITDVMKEASVTSGTYIKCIIHTTQEDIYDVRVLSKDVVRDYIHKNADQTFIKTRMALGDFLMKIKPFSSNMEATVITYADAAHTEEVSNIRYKLILTISTDNGINSLTLRNNSKQVNDLKELAHPNFQLVDRPYEVLSMLTASGIYSGLNSSTVLNNILSEAVNKIDLNGKKAYEIIQVEDTNNSDPISNLMLPSNTPILAVHKIIQKEVGIYTSDIGLYSQQYKNKNSLFVYGIYNPKRYNTDKDRLTILLSDENRTINNDKTMSVKNGVITILASPSKENMTDITKRTHNKVLGFTMPNAKAMNKGLSTGTSGTSEGNPKDIEDAILFQNKKDGLDYAPTTEANHKFEAMSNVAKNVGDRLDVMWHASSEEVIYPMMPVEVLVQTGTDVLKIYGVVVFTQVMDATVADTSDVFNQSTYISLYVTAID